ncbi:ABC transporter permease [Actinomadura livida]|uniref:ABC transporter permease n=1 Tax=Actinomadura livida TaxID=79909 RepID=A0A7W7ICT1_9ACTN|nr:MULTISPECIES: ABC transporter permease [Actinomadura]MBB4774715.1 peptide/nickel transport system permease protein [Actinomadura catellatispora]GGU06455.1 ABC transporter permease [Actinomadura livida]
MKSKIDGAGPPPVLPAEPGLDGRAPARTRPKGRRRVGVWLAGAWLALVISVALLADVLPLADPTVNIAPAESAPFGAWPEFLGTDRLGRSVLSRLAHGAQVSLLIGVLATVFGMAAGVAMGMLSAVRPASDFVLGALTDSLLAVPGVVLLLALGATMGAGLTPLVLGLALYAMPSFARLARGTTRTVHGRPHVQAAQVMGAGQFRILVREILPAVLRPVIAYSVVVLASLVVAEASVSYLGLGVPPPTPTWGGMISDGQSSLDQAPYLVLVPAAILFITVLSLGVLGRSSRQGNP